MSLGKYSPWEPTATLPSAGAAVGSAARGASAPTEGGEGPPSVGATPSSPLQLPDVYTPHIVAAARLQLV